MRLNVGIIGCGNIANKMAITINNLKDDFVNYAVGSRTIEKAKAFKEKYGFIKAYGSYEELLKDENVDLVYIATPHSCHYEEMLMCLKYNKHVICEKILTTSSKDTIDIYKKFKEKNLLLVEALWTSFMPSRNLINNLLYVGKVIGEIKSLKATFSMDIFHVERIKNKSLGGGAAMDLGVYPISFVLRTLGFDYENIKVVKNEFKNHVDVDDEIEFTYANNVKAIAICCATRNEKSNVLIYGTSGYIEIDRVSNPSFIKIFDLNNNLIKEIDTALQYGGFECEILETKAAILNNKYECDSWTHENSIIVSKIVDLLINE